MISSPGYDYYFSIPLQSLLVFVSKILGFANTKQSFRKLTIKRQEKRDKTEKTKNGESSKNMAKRFVVN